MTFIPARNYVKIRRHHKSLWIQHSDAISVLALSPDKSFIYSASWDKTFKIWRVTDFKCLESVAAHDDAVTSLIPSKSGYLYTTTSNNNKPSAHKHALVATLEGHKAAVNALVLSPDEQLLYSASTDRKILIWEREYSAEHMTLLGALRGHRQAVLCLAVADEFLCSGSADKTIRVWRKGENNVHACVALLEGHLGPVKALSMLPARLHHENVNEGSSSSSRNGSNRSSSNDYVVYSGSLDSDARVWLVSPDENFPSNPESTTCLRHTTSWRVVKCRTMLGLGFTLDEKSSLSTTRRHDSGSGPVCLQIHETDIRHNECGMSSCNALGSGEEHRALPPTAAATKPA